MADYIDSSGRALSDYPRPSVAVDTAVLTVSPAGTLTALLVRSGDMWRLPGTFLHEGETLTDAVLRSLRFKAGVTGLAPKQLHVFDDPDRDDRGWVLSVAHLDAVPFARLSIDDSIAGLVPIADVPSLPYGHNQIIERAVDTLRTAYAKRPDPAGFLPRPFRLRDLQLMHEAVAGRELQRDTFRRTMERRLRPTVELDTGSVGKPARLFRD